MEKFSRLDGQMKRIRLNDRKEKDEMYQLGFIGCGNMGGAMLKKMLNTGLFQPENVIISDKNADVRNQWAKDWGVNVTDDNREAAKAEILFLAVKPQFLRNVTNEIKDCISENTLFISIVMSFDLQLLSQILELPKSSIVRVMPNTPALVGEGVLAACRNEYVSKEQWDKTMEMLSCMGLAREVSENLMEAVTGVSGCGPAFAYLFMEALADGGVRGGLTRKMALEFAAQTLLGSAKMLLETGKHPGELKDMVTSPAGATIEGVAALEKNGFRYAAIEAVEAAIRRAKSFETK